MLCGSVNIHYYYYYYYYYYILCKRVTGEFCFPPSRYDLCALRKTRTMKMVVKKKLSIWALCTSTYLVMESSPKNVVLQLKLSSSTLMVFKLNISEVKFSSNTSSWTGFNVISCPCQLIPFWVKLACLKYTLYVNTMLECRSEMKFKMPLFIVI